MRETWTPVGGPLDSTGPRQAVKYVTGGAPPGGGPGASASAPAPRPVTFHGGTSAAFESKIRGAADSVPEAVWAPLAAARVEIRGGRLVSDGGIQGYDAHGGAYRPARGGKPGFLVVAEYRQDRGREVPTQDPEATFYHELGHPVYDHVLTPRERLDFGKVAGSEALAVPFGDRARLFHFVVPPQPREIFAESFTTAMGRNSPDLSDFRRHFPASVAVVERIIARRKASHGSQHPSSPGGSGGSAPAP